VRAARQPGCGVVGIDEGVALVDATNAEDWPFSSFHRDNRDHPKPGDFSRFEQALAEYAGSGHASGYGERA
jgi:hypothetical protein